MFQELLGKMKNKPSEMVQVSSEHLPDRVDILMEQMKNLIDINKTLNGKVKDLEARVSSSSQSLNTLAQQLDAQTKRTQSFEQVIVKCTQVLQKLQGVRPTVAQASTTPQVSSLSASSMRLPPIPSSNPLLLKEARAGNYFHLRDGRQLKNLQELKIALTQMEDEEFRLYVNESKNDVASWIRYCLENPILAGELGKYRNRTDMLVTLNNLS
jgi:hypothetical protein